MGQFLDYLASVFTISSSKESVEPAKTKTHVTFADMSPFAFSKSNQTDSSQSKPALLSQSNKRTTYGYMALGLFACIVQFVQVSVPIMKFDMSNFPQVEFWQDITLTLVPLITYVAAFSAMNEINKPVASCARLTSKNAGLDFRNNQFIQSLKLVIVLMVVSQLVSIYSNDIRYLWLAVVMVCVRYYHLTMSIAEAEQKRYAPSPKKQWTGLNIVRSPKSNTTSPTPSSPPEVQQNRATPRTRTRRAVKNLITGVSDKYHAFEQNVAHQISQKIFTPLSPKSKMIE